MLMNESARTITGPKDTVRLTQSEFAIIKTLAARPNVIVPYETIQEAVRATTNEPTCRGATFRVVLYTTREKCQQVGLGRAAIETVRGHGLCFNA